DYPALLTRARAVADDVARRSAWRAQVDRLGIAVHERIGAVRFLDGETLEAANGRRFEADRVILCAGGTSRRLAVPGAALTVTHSDAWRLDHVPASLLVIGGGMTGLQVAWIFQTFGSRVRLMDRSRR